MIEVCFLLWGILRLNRFAILPSAPLRMTSANIVPIALTASGISILSRETPDVTILSNVKYAT